MGKTFLKRNNKDTETTSKSYYSSVFIVDFEQIFSHLVETKTTQTPLLLFEQVCLENCIWCQPEAFTNIYDGAI